MYNQISANKRNSFLLMIFSVAFVMGVAYLIQFVYGYDNSFLIGALIFSIISNLFAYFAGDKVALGVNGAKEIQQSDNPYVYRLVENLCITAGVPTPKIYIIEDSAMNAFATGRDPQHASIAMTSGIISGLQNEELEGVIAHELSHVKNYDVRYMTMIVVLIGTLSILVNMIFRFRLFGGRRDRNSEGGGILAILGLIAIILSPIIGQIIKLAVSRQREYLADASGVLLTRYPEGLARALEKIGAQNQPMARANDATAHLFIANPFKPGFSQTVSKLFSTHPPIQDRIKQLNEMGNIK